MNTSRRLHIELATFGAKRMYLYNMFPVIPTGDGSSQIQDRSQIAWTALPKVAKSCRELIHCGCQKSCRGPCRCHKAGDPIKEMSSD